ncbi:8-oxoguanine DNA glycosylase [Oribacterium sp. oral taxon 102]|uniref:DNA-3-methyladenine glycosylase family protein n=1 Tax=Oribacterium sp. oral taxon 102 TaxID=671214 RepID=UPI0015BB307B|nr:DNA glycosylase [Oribacterium sp. oral taxon 102]NWO21209.1 8-oxoguanine DNA glycosylase [Oribacterium sp. oral taxon 102]
MQIELQEALSLEKIMDSGQCFRACRLDQYEAAGGIPLYRFITGENVLYARQLGRSTLGLSCTEAEWEEVWTPYFDLGESYSALCRETDAGDAYLQASIVYGEGIRVLRQDRFEVLISFLLSQRKSIPAIRTSVERLCEGFGRRKQTEYGSVALFPDAARIAEMSDGELRDCGLGYRAAYVRDAAERVLSGALPLSELDALSDQELYEALCTVRGVGRKVANCVMLFAYHRVERVPEDVWVNRIVEKRYQGRNPFPAYRKAGLLQQYMFYYAIQHKTEMNG